MSDVYDCTETGRMPHMIHLACGHSMHTGTHVIARGGSNARYLVIVGKPMFCDRCRTNAEIVGVTASAPTIRNRAASRNLAAEIRAVEEGHRAYVVDGGAIEVVSDTHAGKRYRIEFRDAGAQGIVFTCRPHRGHQ